MKTYVVGLIWSALQKRFIEYPQCMFLWRKKKTIFLIPPLSCSYELYIFSYFTLKIGLTFHSAEETISVVWKAQFCGENKKKKLSYADLAESAKGWTSRKKTIWHVVGKWTRVCIWIVKINSCSPVTVFFIMFDTICKLILYTAANKKLCEHNIIWSTDVDFPANHHCLFRHSTS